MPKSKHWAAQKSDTGSGGERVVPATPRVRRPIGQRTLADVLFSLRVHARRARRYDLEGNTRSLEIERTVGDRLLTEFYELGGKQIDMVEVERRGW